MASIAPSRVGIRDDRGFFFGLAVAMALTNVFCFGLQFAMGRSTFGAPALVHAHALAFMGWIGFFVFQSWLVANGRINQHRLLGWLGAGWAALMVVLGIAATVAMVRAARAPFFFMPGYFLVMNPLSVLVFAGVLWWAVAWRRRTHWHRRLVMVAMTAIMGPAFGRLLPGPLMIPWAAWGIFAATMLFPLTGMVHDTRRYGRVHPAWWVGSALLVAMQVAMDVITISPLGTGFYAFVTSGSPGARLDPLAYPPFPPPFAPVP
ncbi:hypothetical protein SAMN05428950_102607 [Sphingomonas sp. OV641]|uniref:hypothetical protein n=1 Tax=Sphingomonas sp. OV641 TaxID=1881068 RepID=UPI0008CD998D|nr:hypothetical protein [Sphingomonas sp. OV641]SEJ69977.1 hypothetical protein SAMN05428950_102607 [Sphingomonas sp. OV641]